MHYPNAILEWYQPEKNKNVLLYLYYKDATKVFNLEEISSMEPTPLIP